MDAAKLREATIGNLQRLAAKAAVCVEKAIDQDDVKVALEVLKRFPPLALGPIESDDPAELALKAEVEAAERQDAPQNAGDHGGMGTFTAENRPGRFAGPSWAVASPHRRSGKNLTVFLIKGRQHGPLNTALPRCRRWGAIAAQPDEPIVTRRPSSSGWGRAARPATGRVDDGEGHSVVARNLTRFGDA